MSMSWKLGVAPSLKFWPSKAYPEPVHNAACFLLLAETAGRLYQKMIPLTEMNCSDPCLVYGKVEPVTETVRTCILTFKMKSSSKVEVSSCAWPVE